MTGLKCGGPIHTPSFSWIIFYCFFLIYSVSVTNASLFLIIWTNMRSIRPQHLAALLYWSHISELHFAIQWGVKVFLCGSVVEYCVSSANGCVFDSQGTQILTKNVQPECNCKSLWIKASDKCKCKVLIRSEEHVKRGWLQIPISIFIQITEYTELSGTSKRKISFSGTCIMYRVCLTLIMQWDWAGLVKLWSACV